MSHRRVYLRVCLSALILGILLASQPFITSSSYGLGNSKQTESITRGLTCVTFLTNSPPHITYHPFRSPVKTIRCTIGKRTHILGRKCIRSRSLVSYSFWLIVTEYRSRCVWRPPQK